MNKINQMETKELKNKINSALDNFPDDVLEEVLKYLKSLTNKSKKDIEFSQNLRKILDEDGNLLERLDSFTENYEMVVKLPVSKTLRKRVRIKSITKFTPKIII